MAKSIARVVAMFMLMMTALVPVAAAQDATPAASPVATPVVAPGTGAAVEWLISQQQEDGSWLGFSGDPDVGTTIDAVVALVAAQEGDLDTGDSIDKAIAYLDGTDATAEYATSGPGAAAKLVLLLVAVGDEDMEIGGTAPLEIVLEGLDADTNLYGASLYDHSYALMALAVTDSEVPAEAISVLETMQADNGGFAWDGSTDASMADSNTTAMLVQALVALGEGDSQVVAKAIDYVKLTVNEQGAAYSVGAEADANSTALVSQALIAVGEDATHLQSALGTFQNANGAYHWMHSDVTDNAFTTVQVIPAGVGVALPVVPGETALDIAA